MEFLKKIDFMRSLWKYRKRGSVRNSGEASEWDSDVTQHLITILSFISLFPKLGFDILFRDQLLSLQKLSRFKVKWQTNIDDDLAESTQSSGQIDHGSWSNLLTVGKWSNRPAPPRSSFATYGEDVIVFGDLNCMVGVLIGKCFDLLVISRYRESS